MKKLIVMPISLLFMTSCGGSGNETPQDTFDIYKTISTYEAVNEVASKLSINYINSVNYVNDVKHGIASDYVDAVINVEKDSPALDITNITVNIKDKKLKEIKDPILGLQSDQGKYECNNSTKINNDYTSYKFYSFGWTKMEVVITSRTSDFFGDVIQITNGVASGSEVNIDTWIDNYDSILKSKLFNGFTEARKVDDKKVAIDIIDNTEATQAADIYAVKSSEVMDICKWKPRA